MSGLDSFSRLEDAWCWLNFWFEDERRLQRPTIELMPFVVQTVTNFVITFYIHFQSINIGYLSL